MLMQVYKSRFQIILQLTVYLMVIIIIIIFFFFSALGSKCSRGLKYRKISVSEWLGVVVRNCFYQKAAMEANAVKALDSD